MDPEERRLGDISFISGSTAEGQTYARHLADQNIQDIDVLIHNGTVKSEENLIRTKVPGFVRIRFDDQIQPTGSAKILWKVDQNGNRCVDGLSLKTEHCTTEEQMSFPISHMSQSGRTELDSSSASTNLTIDYRSIDVGEQFHVALQRLEEMSNESLNWDIVQENYSRFCLNVLQVIRDHLLQMFQNSIIATDINEQTIKDIFAIAGPAYGYALPQVTLVRLHCILDFYEKYSYIGNPEVIPNIVEYFQACLPNDIDLVPSLQLKFWPKDIHPFLDRISKNRPHLGQLIREKTSMHVIPKWSRRTPSEDRDLEFRYSFSAIELILAQHRTREGQILNGIARSIYYKFLKGLNVIPSYFVKTTVLYICEIMNLDGKQAEELAGIWLAHAIERLNAHYCPHYIIPGVNILEPFSIESIQKAKEILLKVNIDETHQNEMFSSTKQQFYRDRYTRNFAYFVSRLKVKDIRHLVDDYRQFQSNWIRGDSQVVVFDDEIDLTNVFIILNLLRALDGDQQNWKRFRRIFCEKYPPRPPLCGEIVDCGSALDFVQTLSTISGILTFMNESVLSNNLLSEQSSPYTMADMMSYRNVINSSLDPRTLYSNIQSTYSYFYNDSVDAFERRRVIDHHPYGPGRYNSSKHDDTEVARFLLKICLNADDENITVKEAYRRQIDSMTEDEQLALAFSIP